MENQSIFIASETDKLIDLYNDLAIARNFVSQNSNKIIKKLQFKKLEINSLKKSKEEQIRNNS